MVISGKFRGYYTKSRRACPPAGTGREMGGHGKPAATVPKDSSGGSKLANDFLDGNAPRLCLRARTALLLPLCGLQILKYTKYSDDFQTFIWAKIARPVPLANGAVPPEHCKTAGFPRETGGFCLNMQSLFKQFSSPSDGPGMRRWSAPASDRLLPWGRPAPQRAASRSP